MSSRGIRPFSAVILLLGLLHTVQGRQAPPLEVILKNAGENVGRYAANLLNIVCTETSVQQELDTNGEPAKTPPTELVYDFMTVPRGGGPAVSEQRELKLINGKPAGPDGSFPLPDPTAYTTSLFFLLRGAQQNFVFTFAGSTQLDGHDAFMVDFAPTKRSAPGANWDRGFFHLGFQTNGRIWIEASSYEVLRLDTHLIAPFEFRSPNNLKRKGPFFAFAPGKKFKVQKWDVTVRYRPVPFQDPEQMLSLPVSAESIRLIHGLRVPHLRMTHTFSGYRRFTAETKVVHSGELEPSFRFQNNFWVNLHATLRGEARRRSLKLAPQIDIAGLTDAERKAWFSALDAYQDYGRRNVIFDQKLVRRPEQLASSYC